MSDTDKELTGSEDRKLFFRKTAEGYESEHFELYPGFTVEAVKFLSANSKITILGIERACNGDRHDANGTIEFTDIGCSHTDWDEFHEVYVENSGWRIDTPVKIVDSFSDIDLEAWGNYYDLWYDGECRNRHVLAKDNETGEIVLYRISHDYISYYLSADDCDAEKYRWNAADRIREVSVIRIVKLRKPSTNTP